MISSKKRYEGMTLLEVLLVFAIAVSILLLSIQQYSSYRTDANISEVQLNVDTIFQAMAKFYRGNCYGTFNSLASPPIFTPGKLSPTATSPVVLKMRTDLVGLISFPLRPNPIVNKDEGTDGYIAQFNMTSHPRTVCTTPNCTTPTQVGTVIVWNAQVAVAIKDKKLALQYKNMLGADCVSSAMSGGSGGVKPCSTTASSGSGSYYVVWQRLPSLVSSQSNSTYSGMMPLTTQFTQMYTTYPILDLMDGAQTGNQYYVCGN